jgi:hypothetical protein
MTKEGRVHPRGMLVEAARVRVKTEKPLARSVSACGPGRSIQIAVVASVAHAAGAVSAH